ncbi:hypothetical protein [Pseudobacteriovorax antillogorgiicola]|uniref:Uncharacterized protein n=1 Tax=Pseudobacteriovorax antillogorgiicola TaxID=1513793 RepID=A0A1Y6BUG7_9BACT|nr:hypothetical protein [Pseudobacteriovorax antillogorgiicola]TCS52396.1 hypothetical protein EDD56_109141 [Pseudobacteriovorax antillogorgiicola]SMF29057.1 hypothetical protein SAMN06296036_10972 [Pseudobacteriovorax antillogorgiicola]
MKKAIRTAQAALDPGKLFLCPWQMSMIGLATALLPLLVVFYSYKNFSV